MRVARHAATQDLDGSVARLEGSRHHHRHAVRRGSAKASRADDVSGTDPRLTSGVCAALLRSLGAAASIQRRTTVAFAFGAGGAVRWDLGLARSARQVERLVGGAVSGDWPRMVEHMAVGPAGPQPLENYRRFGVLARRLRTSGRAPGAQPCAPRYRDGPCRHPRASRAQCPRSSDRRTVAPARSATVASDRQERLQRRSDRRAARLRSAAAVLAVIGRSSGRHFP
jgi:hypothetical protein